MPPQRHQATRRTPGQAHIGNTVDAMREFYPPIEPNRTGMLDVGDANLIYWEESGNPLGKPALFLHGGPGGGTTPAHRQLFNPEKYRIILFDQRNCGKSTPHASTPGIDLSHNTTWDLVADIEKLREHLGVDRWLVYGGSWGSTLTLAYAQTHPERVTEILLRGIFTLRETELDWFYEGGAAAVYPDLWERYMEPIPADWSGSNIDAYAALLYDEDPAVAVHAAKAWVEWESSTITLLPPVDSDAADEGEYDLAFARIENHYFVNKGWLTPNQLIENAHLLSGIPAAIVQGRYDMCTPMMTAWALHKAWPEAEFTVVPDGGHAFSEPGIRSGLIDALDRFAER